MREHGAEARLVANRAHLAIVLRLHCLPLAVHQLAPFAVHLVIAQVAECARPVNLGRDQPVACLGHSFAQVDIRLLAPLYNRQHVLNDRAFGKGAQ